MTHTGSRRGGILGIFLVIATVFVAVCVIVGYNVARNVRIHETNGRDGEQVSIQTPVGNLNIRARDHAGADISDVQVYPGATTTKKGGGGASFEWSSADGMTEKNLAVAGNEYLTQDPASKVVDFYRNQLPHWMISTESDGTTKLELKDGGYRRIIAIHEKHDGTHIGVATIGTPAAN